MDMILCRNSSATLIFSGDLRKKAKIDVSPVIAENRIIGVGSCMQTIKKLKAETDRPKKLQIPRAVEANKVGNSTELAMKLILAAQAMPSLHRRNKTKNQGESMCQRPHAAVIVPPIHEIANEKIRLYLIPTLLASKPDRIQPIISVAEPIKASGYI